MEHRKQTFNRSLKSLVPASTGTGFLIFGSRDLQCHVSLGLYLLVGNSYLCSFSFCNFTSYIFLGGRIDFPFDSNFGVTVQGSCPEILQSDGSRSIFGAQGHELPKQCDRCRRNIHFTVRRYRHFALPTK